jgi:hypothetical protein
MTVGSSGLAFVVAVWCLYRIGVVLRLPWVFRLGLPLSLGISTLAPVYARHVNNHILLLGVAAALALGLLQLSLDIKASGCSRSRVLSLGTLAGLGYAIELAAGPALLVSTLALVTYRCRRIGAVATFVLGALPWVVLHHAVNYALVGTLRPAGSVPEYLQWPGSPHARENLTGLWLHQSPADFLTYAMALLVGERGILIHNPALILAILGLAILLLRRAREWPELLWAACWSGATWLTYSFLSNNYAGACCSIRWLVPLLAPGYFVLALFLRDYPRFGWVLLVISVWECVLVVFAWQRGPWQAAHRPMVWLTWAGLLLTGAMMEIGRRRLRDHDAWLPPGESERLPRAA